VVFKLYMIKQYFFVVFTDQNVFHLQRQREIFLQLVCISFGHSLHLILDVKLVCTFLFANFHLIVNKLQFVRVAGYGNITIHHHDTLL
jgi:hypothetical protein